MPMDSEKLSARSKQPGHDQSYQASEANFIDVARRCLDSDKYDILDKPSELRDLFPAELPDQRSLGIQPEAAIINRSTGRRFFVEVKKQGDRGNADERACKHHTVQFYRTLHEKYGYDYHPFVTVFCESLAVHPRYTRKSPYFFEKDNYFNWQDYEAEHLCEYLQERCRIWLD